PRTNNFFTRTQESAWRSYPTNQASTCDEPLRVLAEPVAKPISSRLMALPECFAALTAIKSIPCEKSRLGDFPKPPY
ncbi:MAG: hypothetical protein WB679_04975, partial [Terracidiphilus sp.]